MAAIFDLPLIHTSNNLRSSLVVWLNPETLVLPLEFRSYLVYAAIFETTLTHRTVFPFFPPDCIELQKHDVLRLLSDHYLTITKANRHATNVLWNAIRHRTHVVTSLKDDDCNVSIFN